MGISILSAQDPSKRIPFAVSDATASLLRVTDALVDQGAAVDVADEEDAERIFVSFASQLAFGGTIHPSTVIVVLEAVLINWKQNGFALFETLVSQGSLAVDSHAPNATVVGLTWRSLEALVPLHRDPANQVAAEKCSQLLFRLARELEIDGERELALACVLSSSSFLDDDNGQVLPILEMAVRLATGAADRDARSLLLLRCALVRTGLAQRDSAHQIGAFDAIETALRYLPQEEGLRDDVLNSLLQPATANSMRTLQTMIALIGGSISVDGEPPDPELVESVDLFARPVWDLEREDLVRAVINVNALATSVENERQPLLAKEETSVAEASWVSFAFTHRAFRSAVPHGDSLLRESELDELLLTLHHEITHVFSMLSGVGIAILALRAARLGTEADLWSFTPDGHVVSAVQMFSDRVAPLGEHGVLALGVAERALELTRKAHILEAVWAPWFEGLAVFSELASDPLRNTYTTSPVIDVLTNLTDSYIANEAETSGDPLSKIIANAVHSAEERYSHAVNSDAARFRLRTYLDRLGTKYAAGYLAVRHVISCWRRALNRPLVGVDAAMLLLHVTRFGTLDAVPDLGLPCEEFAREATRSMLKWVGEVAQISGADLTISSDMRSNGRWSHGRWVPSSPSDSDDKIGERESQERLRQALSSMQGDAADMGRAPDAQDDSVAIMRMVASRLEQEGVEPSELVMSFWSNATTSSWILPVGQTVCPFWVDAKDRSLIYCVRTTEHDHLDGGSSYNAEVLPLPDDSFDELVKELNRHCASRLTLTRVVDLLQDSSKETYDRGYGANYFVFQFGDWLYVSPRGFRFGVRTVAESLLSAIRQRMHSVSTQFAFDWMTQLSDDGVDGAIRTRDWIDRAVNWTAGDAICVVGGWVTRVRELAELVVRGPTDTERMANGRLVDLVFGPDSGAPLADEGLRVDDECTLELADIVREIHSTALSPTASTWLSDHSDEVDACVAPLFKRTSLGWDIVSPIFEDEERD